MTDRLCPWMDPIMRYTVEDCVREGHGTHKARLEPSVYCSCLVPPGKYLMEGHKGTEECCTDYCNECGIRACFVCACYMYESSGYDPDDYFSVPGGNSALRAATGNRCPHHGCHKRVGTTWNNCAHCGGILNPRKFPCPTCYAPNVLTQADLNRHYQCDQCADRAEGRYYGYDY